MPLGALLRRAYGGCGNVAGHTPPLVETSPPADFFLPFPTVRTLFQPFYRANPARYGRLKGS